MNIGLLVILLLANLTSKLTEGKNCTTKNSESNSFLYGSVFESSEVDSILSCVLKCSQNELCASINMNLLSLVCDLSYSTKKRHPEKAVHRQNMVYMEIRDDKAAAGSRPDIPIKSCKKLKEDDSQAKSGVYWMKFNEPSSAPFQVFCDMTTGGGGWTLVYSYRILQQNSFNADSNAVTPIPNWPTAWSPSGFTPRSTTTPLDESAHSAMDFALWKKIGNEVLIKPNISNWVACVEGTGSLVNWVQGTVTCRIVKAITPTCTNVVPTDLVLYYNVGAASLKLNGKHYIHLVSSTTLNWPCHDPCGTTSYTTHLTNVPTPGGVLYIR